MTAASREATERDARSRSVAQREFAAPLVLEAGAGTGKTAVLVARVVVWCLGAGWERNAARFEGLEGLEAGTEDRVAAETLRRVVAITFTEAAAAEMETRVRIALLEVERGERPLGVEEESLPADPEVRRLRATALVARLDQLGVRTIHAWCRRLLTAHPLEADLHPRFEVDADGRRQREVVREVLERRLSEAYSGDAVDDHRALAVAGVGPDGIEEALVHLVEQGVPPEVLARDPFEPEAVAALAERLRLSCEVFLAAGGEELAGLSGVPVASKVAGRVVETLDRLGAQTRGDVAGLLEIAKLWEAGDVTRLRTWAKGSFGKREEAALGESTPDVAAAAEPLHIRIQHLRRLDPEALGRALRVLQPLLAEVRGELRARGVESFDALLQDAARLVAGPAVDRIRGEIDQLLVDEFQDTDGTQCEILRCLVLRAPEPERPGLFLVGDPKQSIYGWRRADLAAWYDFVEEIRDLGGAVHELVVNFRSVPAVLDEVERLLEPLMEEVPRVQPAFQRLEPSPKLAAAEGFTAGGRRPVEHWVSWAWDSQAGEHGERVERTRLRDATEIEAAAIAADIAALNQDHQVAWDDFAILLRSLGELEVYLGALRDAKVPYVVERDRSYYQRREIVEAQALVRVVLDPLDTVALVALLRSAWVGVPDAALAPLWHEQLPDLVAGIHDGRETTHGDIRDLVSAASAAVGAEAPGLGRIAGWERSLGAALEAVGALRAAFEREPADRFVELLRGALAAEPCEAARYLGGYRVANLDRFFRDLVKALEETGGDAPAVLAHLRRAVTDEREAEEGRPRDAGDDAVHVTTIHKAKGLGFRQVYLAQMHKKERRDTHAAPRVSLRDGRFEFALFGAPTPGFDRAGEGEIQLKRAERVRLLYVAATRARDRLVLCGARESSGDESFAALAARRDETPELESWMRELAGAGGEARVDPDGVRWRFVALAPDAEPATEPEADAAWDPAERLESARSLATERERAQEREARPFSAPASEKDALKDEARGETPDRVFARRDEARKVATLAGSAVHAALEHLDPEDESAGQRARGLDEIERVLAFEARPELRARAHERAVSLLDEFLAGPLRARLREIAPAVVARELPVLVKPRAPEEPVGFVSGSIDLLYRDGSQWVVADFKTDRIEPGEDLGPKVERYRGQGDFYTRAIAEALALPTSPRFELWFIQTGRIEVLAANA